MQVGNSSQLTDLAETFGHPSGPAHKIISYTGHSGYTPLRELPLDALSTAQVNYRRAYNEYNKTDFIFLQYPNLWRSKHLHLCIDGYRMIICKMERI